MDQKRRHSFLEQVVSTSIGFLIALLTQVIVFPLYNLEITLLSNLEIAGIFTLISILRGYWIRRLFNSLHLKGIL